MAEHGAAEPNAQLQLGLQAQAADVGAEAGPGAAGDDADGAAGAMLDLAARGEAADGAEGDGAAVFGAMLAPDAGPGPPGDQPVGDQPAAARGEADPADDDEIGVEEAIANAAADTGCASTFADALPAMCFLGNVTQLTVVMLGNQIACARSMPTTLRLAQGTDRVEAAAEYAEQLYATSVHPSVSKNALTGALLSVLDVVFPQEAPRPDTATRAATARDGSPDTGFIRKAMAVWQVGKEHSHTSKEMPEADMGRLATGVGALLGFASQGTSGLAAPPQTKIMHKEVQVHKRIPSVGSVQPENIVRAGGDHGIAAPKAEKSKELTAEPTTSSLELRDRFATFCITLAACLMDMPDTPAEKMRSAALASLGMMQAMKDARSLTSYAQVDHAIKSALAAARRAQNCDPSMRQGFTAALNKGADAIIATNGHVDRTAALSGDTATRGGGDTTTHGGDAGPVTLTQLRDLIKGIPRAKGGGGNLKGGGDQEKVQSKMVKLPDGTNQLFKRGPGGNPECPVKCTKDHRKESWCHLSHADK